MLKSLCHSNVIGGHWNWVSNISYNSLKDFKIYLLKLILEYYKKLLVLIFCHCYHLPHILVKYCPIFKILKNFNSRHIGVLKIVLNLIPRCDIPCVIGHKLRETLFWDTL